MISMLIVPGTGSRTECGAGTIAWGRHDGVGHPTEQGSNSFFDDSHEGQCPQFTSLIYSAVNRFSFVIPTSGLDGVAAYSDKSEDTGFIGTIFANSSCRYKITMKKFIRQGEIEIELQKRTGEKKLQKIVEDINKIAATHQ
ncbi:MAG: hypothetical protein J2P31_12960 [Blastocatellia bacterium]|nr:hypothetical protein [Blastocatellia bacterium]